MDYKEVSLTQYIKDTLQKNVYVVAFLV